MARDDFLEGVRRELAERASLRCCNPDCGALTCGPADFSPDGSTRLGRAAHITAASARGPRYDHSLTSEQRRSSSNGLWLCTECADRIDRLENAPAFPIALLKLWKIRQESAAGTGHALIEFRRRMPLMRLEIEDACGVVGRAHVVFGATSVFTGTLKLSRNISESLMLFSSQRAFRSMRQPPDGTTGFAMDVADLGDGVRLRAHVTHPPRSFARSGRLAIELSSGDSFSVSVTTDGARLKRGAADVGAFSPVLRTVAVLERQPGSRKRIRSKNAIKAMSVAFSITASELRTILSDASFGRGPFGFEIDASGMDMRIRTGLNSPWLGLWSLSGGERDRVVLDVAVRLARHRSVVAPTVLLIDQRAVPTMSGGGWESLVEWIQRHRPLPPFQTVIDAYNWDAKMTSDDVLLYDAVGDDMDVTSFSCRSS